MRTVLHIVTRPADSLAQEIIARQRETSNLRVSVIDLTTSEPDYDELLREIFEANSVAVW